MKSVSLIVIAAAGCTLAACASTGPQAGSVQRQGSLAEAAATPLSDVNLVKVEIPDVLKRAVADAYDPRGMGDCRAIAAEIRRLDDALGPDTDRAPEADTRTDMARTADDAHGVAVTVVREGVKSVVPFRGWIRQISGAARHEKAVDDAITAGSTRRGYLKGVGMRLNCAPPAAPAWFVPVRQTTAQRRAPR